MSIGIWATLANSGGLAIPLAKRVQIATIFSHLELDPASSLARLLKNERTEDQHFENDVLGSNCICSAPDL